MDATEVIRDHINGTLDGGAADHLLTCVPIDELCGKPSEPSHANDLETVIRKTTRGTNTNDRFEEKEALIRCDKGWVGNAFSRLYSETIFPA